MTYDTWKSTEPDYNLGDERPTEDEEHIRYLETELDRRLDEIKTAAEVNETLQIASDKLAARVIELLNERDKYADALRKIAAYKDFDEIREPSCIILQQMAEKALS